MVSVLAGLVECVNSDTFAIYLVCVLLSLASLQGLASRSNLTGAPAFGICMLCVFGRPGSKLEGHCL